MQCLSIADPAAAELILAQLRAIDPGLEVTHYAGGSLRRKAYDLLIVGTHVSSRGVSMGGDAHLAPVALGNLAAAAKARAIFIASCDGAGIALEIAGQAKSAAVIFYAAALDPDTAQRLAVNFAEEYFCEGPTMGIEGARNAGYEVLNPIYTMTENSGSSNYNNPDMMRVLLDLQKNVSETQADMRHMRDDVASLKSKVDRIGDAQTAQTAQATQAAQVASHTPISMTPNGVFLSLVLIALFAISVAVILSRLAGA